MFLVHPVISAVFLCLFFLSFFLSFLSYCVWGLLFPGSKESWILSLKKVEFFLLFGFCPPKVCQWFVWALYRVRFVLSFCFFDCFSSDGQGGMRWYSCLLMTGFVFLFCLLFACGVLHRVVGWCQVLYSSGFLSVSSHYLILLRVSSVVV